MTHYDQDDRRKFINRDDINKTSPRAWSRTPGGRSPGQKQRPGNAPDESEDRARAWESLGERHARAPRRGAAAREEGYLDPREEGPCRRPEGRRGGGERWRDR